MTSKSKYGTPLYHEVKKFSNMISFTGNMRSHLIICITETSLHTSDCD